MLEDSTSLMQQQSLTFYYWRFNAGTGPGELTRHAIVNEVVVPIFDDPAVRAAVDCVYARKYSQHPPALSSAILLERSDDVRLFVASAPQRRPQITTLVARHVASRLPVAGPFDYPAKERAGQPDCTWYRRCLTQVTTVALDLHRAADFAAHRRFVCTLDTEPGMRALTRAALHEYLLEHSRSYVQLGDEGWTRFWYDFHRWGPAPNLYPPGHVLENLLLID